MAAAFAEAFALRGATPTVFVKRAGFVHALVAVDGVYYDHRGAHFEVDPGYGEVDSAQLPSIAAEFGVCLDQFRSDKAQAAQILQEALASMDRSRRATALRGRERA